MILTIDVGNSHIVVGVFKENELVFVSRFGTDTKKTEDEYAVLFYDTLKINGIKAEEIHGAILSSVVPHLNVVLKKAVKLCFKVSCLVVGPGVKTGITINTDSPSQVGADLVSAVAAAHEIYKKPTLVLDMGTATKMTVVDEKGVFVGVSIMPGVGMGVNALSGNTAQLPQIGLEDPGDVIGKNTPDCMKSGVVYGNASMIDGMIDRMNNEFGSELFVIATGGFSSVIVPYCNKKIKIDENLLLKGLKIIYDKTKAVL